MIVRGSTRAVVLALLLGLVLSASAAAAPKDKTPPTTPKNLKVTVTKPTSVTLTWSASSDNSGSFTYELSASTGQKFTLAQSSTSFIWSFGLTPGATYSFAIQAVDKAGNRSGTSTATVTLPLDTTPPTTPVLSVTAVGATQVSLAWTASTDDSSAGVWYTVLVNGSPGVDVMQGHLKATVPHLQQGTAYVFAVQARDAFGNTATSATVSATTGTSSDGGAPTAPTDLVVWDQFCGEVMLFWTQSTDDADPQSALAYEVYVNGQFSTFSTVVGRGKTVAYGTVNGPNTFVVHAVDTAGNRSAPSEPVTLNLDLC